MLKQIAFVLILGLSLMSSNATNRSGRWEHGRLLDCDYMFSLSRREKYRHDQVDALLIWLGPPSEAIRVEGKHGTIPLPSAWGSFASVLYTQCIAESEAGQNKFLEFFQQWMDTHPTMKDRPLYLAGNLLDTENGGEFVIHLAHSILFRENTNPGESKHLIPNLRGIFVHTVNPILLPTALFFAEKPFETANGLNFWSINRARQSIQCNTKLSAVELYSYDIKLRYELQSEENSAHSGSEMFTYELATVTDWGQCYEDIDTFAASYSQRDTHLAQQLQSNSEQYYDIDRVVSPALPLNASHNTAPAFPACQNHTFFPPTASALQPKSKSDHSLLQKVNALLAHNVSISFYQDIPHATEIICSFYIGIYIADALQYPPLQPSALPGWQKATTEYNMATMESLPAAWSAAIVSEKSPGIMQQSERMAGEEDDFVPMIMTMFFQSTNQLARTDPSLRSQTTSKPRNRIVVSKMGAIAIFARLLHALSAMEIDLLELLVMDRIDEYTDAAINSSSD